MVHEHRQRVDITNGSQVPQAEERIDGESLEIDLQILWVVAVVHTVGDALLSIVGDAEAEARAVDEFADAAQRLLPSVRIERAVIDGRYGSGERLDWMVRSGHENSQVTAVLLVLRTLGDR